MRSLFFLLIFLPGVAAQAQDYIVTTRKDTLRGKVSVFFYENIDKVELSANNKKTEFAPYHLLGIWMEGAAYRPVRTTSSYRIMKVTMDGMLSLCQARQSAGTAYNIPYLVKISGESLEINNLRFKRTVRMFLEECPTVQQRIKGDTLGRNDLEKIVMEYNQCLERQTFKSEDPKLAALNAFNQKIIQDPAIPADAKGVLRDLYTKVKEGKPLPNYLLDGLRETLKDQAAYQADLDALIAILKK